jgi:Resolvase, N terminal domain
VAQGVAVAQEYIDIETAKQTGRAAFGEMIAYLKAHPSVRVMLVEKTDRLYRNLKDWVTVDELDVEIHFVKGSPSKSSASSRTAVPFAAFSRPVENRREFQEVWPNSAWMVLTLVSRSRRWVAKLCRSACRLTLFLIPAASAASWNKRFSLNPQRPFGKIWFHQTVISQKQGDPPAARRSPARRQRIGELFRAWWEHYGPTPMKANDLAEPVKAIVDQILICNECKRDDDATSSAHRLRGP